MTPERAEALKVELDELVTQLDTELSPQRVRQMRKRVVEIRAELNPPVVKVHKRRNPRAWGRVKLNLLKD